MFSGFGFGLLLPPGVQHVTDLPACWFSQTELIGYEPKMSRNVFLGGVGYPT
jgi:hypothetical protein